MSVHTIEETKSILIKAVDGATQEVISNVTYFTFSGSDLSKSRLKTYIRETKNPDFLEHAANQLIDVGIYYDDERFFFPDDIGEDYE